MTGHKRGKRLTARINAVGPDATLYCVIQYTHVSRLVQGIPCPDSPAKYTYELADGQAVTAHGSKFYVPGRQIELTRIDVPMAGLSE